MTEKSASYGIAVVIPCYRVTRHVQKVVDAIGAEVDAIYCVDDACPDGSGDFIERAIRDPRVRVLRHEQNAGVGGAVMTGYRQAAEDGARVIVKIDGDGQMDPSLIPAFVAPILRREADYTKGNRFWSLREIKQMPLLRRIGNLGLSFMSKASTGYWNIFDPTNGYTAIHADVAARLPFDSISQRYFFETDMLFRLNAMRAVVIDIPMDANYGDETSGLKISNIVGEFVLKHLRNFFKRIGYSYFLRDLSVASFELVLSVGLLSFGAVFTAIEWWHSISSGIPSHTGTVMISAVTLILGVQFALAWLNYDVASVPRMALHPRLDHRFPEQNTL